MKRVIGGGGILLMAALLMVKGQAQLRITSISPSGNVRLDLEVGGAFGAGAVTVERAPSLAGPWVPSKNAYTSGPEAAINLGAPDGTGFYRASAVDLTPSADGFNHLIRSYSLLTTIAGAGQETGNNRNFWQASFEGAPAVEVELSRPHIAMADRAGNLYIADKWAHAIRMVRPDGILVTVAGVNAAGNAPDTATVGIAAALDAPNGQWVRGDGTVFSFGAVVDKCLERNAGIVLAALLEFGPGRIGV